MHYKWQVLVKATSKTEAEDQLDGVMSFGGNGNVWDWYEIGGRWNEKQNIVRATNRSFWKRLRDARKSQARAIKKSQKSLRRYLKQGDNTLTQIVFGKQKNGMAYHCLGKLVDLKNGYYTSESYLATDGDIWGGPEVPPDVESKIRANPTEYWLITVDIHN